MSIKMPVKFYSSYKVTTRLSGVEKSEICQKLSFSPIAGQERGDAAAARDPVKYLITYFSFGCRRVVEAEIKENREDGLVFQAEDREYEFTPTAKSC